MSTRWFTVTIKNFLISRRPSSPLGSGHGETPRNARPPPSVVIGCPPYLSVPRLDNFSRRLVLRPCLFRRSSTRTFHPVRLSLPASAFQPAINFIGEKMNCDVRGDERTNPSPPSAASTFFSPDVPRGIARGESPGHSPR